MLLSKRNPAVLGVFAYMVPWLCVSTAGGDGGARGEEARSGAERAGEKERRRKRETAGTERGERKAEVLRVATRSHSILAYDCLCFLVLYGRVPAFPRTSGL